mgnify:CR=1 FL=1
MFPDQVHTEKRAKFGLFDTWSQFMLVAIGAVLLDALVIFFIVGIISIGGAN